MSIVFKDFGTAYLAAPLAVGGLTITVDNALSLPILANGDYFYLVLQKYSDRSYVEIVKVTATAGNTFTILRGQAGTSIRAFAVGDYAELRLTTDALTEYIAQSISTKMDKSGGGDFSGLYRFLNPSVSRVDIVRTSDSVASSLVVDYSASEGHRTIVGGATGSNVESPSILIRPNGYGSGTGQVKIDSAGLVDAVSFSMRGAQATNPGSAVRFDYLSNFVPTSRRVNAKALSSDINLAASDVGALALSGGTLAGQLVVANMKSAIVVNNQRSISFQDQSSTMFHLMAFGGGLRIGTGDLGATTAVSFDAAGGAVFGSAVYGRVGFIAKSLDDNKWLGIEAPNGATDPYISVRGNNMAVPEPVLYLGTTVTVAKPLIVSSGHIQSKRASNPIGVEMHVPGKSATMLWMDDSGSMNFSSSAGNGGEAARLAGLTGDGFVSYGRSYAKAFSTVWGGTAAFSATAGAETVNVRDGDWYPLIGSGYFTRNQGGSTDGWTMKWSMGYYRTPGQNNGEVDLALTGDGLLSNTLRYRFCSDGIFRIDGTDNGSSSFFGAGGHVGGSIFGGYANMVDWCNAAFAPKSDANLKKNIVDSSVDALALIERFRFRAFDWKESGEHASIGLIAQEVDVIGTEFTGAVRTFAPDGGVDTEIRTLDLVSLISLALKGIQQLNARMPV